MSLAAFAAATALLAPAQEVGRWPAAEARQGVAVDARHFYAIDNSTIAKYDRASGRRLGVWSGDPERFPHLNSCAVIARDLVCAASNYPQTPMVSSVEVFDPVRLRHRRTIPLGRQFGSLTWVQRRNGAWWAGFANYDGRGGEPGRDHRFTTLVRFDDRWRPRQSWRFPDTVLARFAPRSASGGVFGPGGLLIVTGHDLPEAYVLRIPRSGEVLEHLATVPVQVEGQAIAWDAQARLLFGISRAKKEVAAMRLPDLGDK